MSESCSLPSRAALGNKPIGVGLFGASSTNPGWGVLAHLPAIRNSKDFELRAVGTSTRESAIQAGSVFGVEAFHEPARLIEHPGVDLVVVAVKVPEHSRLIEAALRAGKMVFSEWPLARDLSEAHELNALASAAGVRTFVGLQGRFAPAIRQAKALVAEGFIGTPLATTLVGSAMAWGPEARRADAYRFDAINGATTLSVSMLHSLDAINFVLGEFETVSAASTVRRSLVRIVEDGRWLPVTAHDHIAICATLKGGAVASVFFRGGVSRGDNFRWEINGSHGDLVITAANGNIQVADLSLASANGAQTQVAVVQIAPEFAGPPLAEPTHARANVERQYAAIAQDLRDDLRAVPDFPYALKRHRLLSTIETAARTGTMITL